MEADSTTIEVKGEEIDCKFPFFVHPGNHQLYNEILQAEDGSASNEMKIIQWLQNFGMLKKEVNCKSSNKECHMVCKKARVVDRFQWTCESCGYRLPIRHGTFLLRCSCSILQVMQSVLAWCEDADYESVSNFFDIKPRVVNQIYEKLDTLAILEMKDLKLGGNNSVVIAEIYPDCLNRLSPDTTEQPHAHRILMIADTKHIPTQYRLHVLKHDIATRKTSANALVDNKALGIEVSQVLKQVTQDESTIVLGDSLPLLEGASTLQTLLQHCDTDMQHFLCERLWRQAITLCSASRDLCAVNSSVSVCALGVQKYLDASLYKVQNGGDGLYLRMLNLLVESQKGDGVL